MLNEKPPATTGLSARNLRRYVEDIAWGENNPNNLRGKGQRLLASEELGRLWNGSLVSLRIETCGDHRVRFFIQVGGELILTLQMPCFNHEVGKEMARNTAHSWILNTPEFSELKPVRDETREQIMRPVTRSIEAAL